MGRGEQPAARGRDRGLQRDGEPAERPRGFLEATLAGRDEPDLRRLRRELDPILRSITPRKEEIDDPTPDVRLAPRPVTLLRRRLVGRRGLDSPEPCGRGRSDEPTGLSAVLRTKFAARAEPEHGGRIDERH